MKKEQQELTKEKIFPTSVIEHIRDCMVRNGETIAVAESVTSGLLQFAFGTVEEASKFYQGGITAYNVGQKYRHLLIEPIHALECDCVSKQVADEMALQVCTFFKSNWGLSITGYETPVEKAGNKLLAYCSIAHNDEIVYSKEIKPENEDPFLIQVEYATEVLQELNKLMA